jgi:hypothetical protein
VPDFPALTPALTKGPILFTAGKYKDFSDGHG